MKQFLRYSAVAIFAIFIGSQITEGVLLVPYWKSLSSTDFYIYYSEFGPSIGRFYTILTIAAALIPISFSFYCKLSASKAFKYSLISAFFAIIFVSSFYLYFKGANELFYQGTLSESELKNELSIWSYWHWGRIIIESLSILFLIFAFSKMESDIVD